MGTDPAGKYFPFDVQITKQCWEKLRLENVRGIYAGGNVPPIVFYRVVSRRMSQLPENSGKWVQPGLLNMYALLTRIFRHVLDLYEERHPTAIEEALDRGEIPFPSSVFRDTASRFVELFPPVEVLDGGETPSSFLFNDTPPHPRKRRVVRELILLSLASENRAIDTFRQLLDDQELAASSPYRRVISVLDNELVKAPVHGQFGMSLLEVLRAPLKASPDSLRGQVEYIRAKWGTLLPPDLLTEIMTSFDVVAEEEREWWGTPGPPVVPQFDLLGGGTGAGYEYPEYERFSLDADWMSNVVLIAKMVYVWLDQLSKKYERPLNRLDEIPDEELDALQRWGFTSLWLIGIWERSPSSQKIKHIMGNHDAVASAYSLYDYVIAADLGGEAALDDLRERCRRRGIRLSADMVPNHTGIYSKWVQEHPDWFVQVDYPPYPGYNFTGADLSFASHLTIQIEDGYWNKSDAAVVFKHIDHHSGRVRYIYHGNDGTSTPWNDTAQLNYLLPEVREAVIQTILHVARKFPIIRFDAAMTLAKKHYQRLWFPQPGGGGGVPSRAEHAMTREQFEAAFPEEFWREVVDRVAREVPDTLLLAEAFWLMEGYFVRTLGMHRVYNSAFMNMLKMEENAKYRQTVKNVLEFNPEILKRFVNFMNNPDERTAIEQFGKEGKYFGAAVLLVTMPGLPMIGHGQIEGFKEKYGMEYRRAYWEEEPDQHLIRMHEEKIFPLMRRRYLFSGSENFVFYDFFADGHVDENVFAYSNRFGGERGIILYHNKWGDTAGWIRTSTGIAAKSDGEEPTIRQTTLGDALSFNADGRHYYAFRDYSAGLEYLRHGVELVEKGMYVELGAYEYHAFLDFREIYDDEYGNWGKLCFELANRPVANLAEEFVQVQYRHILTPCRELFTTIVERLDQLFDPKVPVAVRGEAAALCRERLEEFFTILAEAAGTKEDAVVTAAQTVAAIGAIERLSRLKSRQTAVRTVLEELRGMLEPDINRLVVFSALAMKGAAVIVGAAEEDAAFYDRFGFRRIVQENVQALVEQGEVSTFPWGDVRDPLLVKILVAHVSFFTEWKEAERSARIADLFSDPAVREFLLIHWSGGVEWFSRERFEGLMQWLWIMALAPAAEMVAEDEELIMEATLLFKTVRELAEIAADAHYRTDDLEALLAAV